MNSPAATDPDAMVCVRGLEKNDRPDLDRLLWCEGCRAAARVRAGNWGWVVGLFLAGFLSVWIWLVVQPTLLIGAWIGTVVAAFWVGSKAAREVIYGAIRIRNASEVEAVPASERPPEEERRVRFH